MARKFPNVVEEAEQDDLNHELSRYCQLEYPEDEEVDQWWAKVAMVENGDGGKCFPVLSKLALSLATIYNSSSEAERDFAKQNDIFSSTKKSNMGQLKLQSRLQVMSATAEASKDCKRCIENRNKRKQAIVDGEKVGRWSVNHCHCSFMIPDENLLVKLKNHEPAKKFKALNTKEDEENHDKEMKNLLDKEARVRDIKREV